MAMRSVILIAAAGLTLTACQSVSDALGGGTTGPDEFRTVTIAPLTVPPEYNLRPPAPGEPRPEEIYPDQRARAALLGAQSEFAGSEAEALLVSRAGGTTADPFIRSIIDGEEAAVVRKSTGFANQVLFWQGRDGEIIGPDNTPLDAEEAARLIDQADRATGGGQVEIERERRILPKLPGL